ncbi:MAG TPA: WYL domain-containing protein [Oribacterium sp.]|nr:WYL domain-containing protein [Oribacterium sp.]
MYEASGKKMLNMLIYDVLQEHSDAEHSISQQGILQILKDEYGVVCDRRSVRNNIDCLIEYGYDIETEGGYRLMSRTFDEGELQLLINSVVFSKFLTKAQARKLIGKLINEGSRYFSPSFTHLRNITNLQRSENKQVLINMDLIDKAIEQKKKISFLYNSYGTDRRMHPRRKEPFLYNPYQIVMSNGCFYLVGNYDKYDTVSHFRIDKMTSMTVLDDPRKDPKEVIGMEHGLNLPQHMAEHIYMLSGPSVTVLLRMRQSDMDVLVDWFGRDVQIMEQYPDGQMDVRLRCNEEAMEYWALQYGKRVTVLEPRELRAKLRADIEEMRTRYQEDTDEDQ